MYTFLYMTAGLAGAICLIRLYFYIKCLILRIDKLERKVSLLERRK